MKEGDIVLCRVEKVTNTVTHVRLPNGEEGTIISSEIAPGRIKYMRKYVVPNKKIVCKVLDIDNGHIHLSLRRVSSKERKEVMKKYRQEQAIKTALGQLLGKKSESIIGDILDNFPDLTSFIDEVRKDEGVLKKYLPEESWDVVRKIAEKRKKEHSLKQRICLKCLEPDGVLRIKNILSVSDENVSVNYVSAGNYLLKLVVSDFREGKKKMNKIIEGVAARAKENKCEFESREER
ncbi:hypothetical protein D6829_01995 [Candidatus Pacearchaeota archaeon]|nr:MAG: hypothetical protein D6829_01995 [Candidatus Pacearchaeota archaeon]